MLQEPTSLASIVDLVADTLRLDFNVDPGALYEALGLSPDERRSSGDRLPNSQVIRMWEVAQDLCPDPSLGVKAGLRARPVHFHVIGYAWMASETLADAIGRLVRYEEILDSGQTDIAWEKKSGGYVLSETYPVASDYIGDLSVDFAMGSIIALCRQATGKPVRAQKLEILKSPGGRALDIYADLVGKGNVVTSESRNAMHFSIESMEAPLPGAMAEVADATLKVADDYVAALGPNKVTQRVREVLMRTLPSGHISQELVASMLHRSTSTLQRQLQSEGTTYREVSEDARRSLAERYLRDGTYSHSQIAFLTGFSDQSNFARAFRRWTGMSPGAFQKSAQSAS